MNMTLDASHCRCHSMALTTRELVERLIRRSEDALDHSQTAASHAKTVIWDGAAAAYYRTTLDVAFSEAGLLRDNLGTPRQLAWR
ncbi:hypothetical protein [Bifidobacterium sp. UBA744]|uniref:hypothetical protein n=1 Tax=Bifidobacterium sp. UBA744 TaxID=1946112 RepID=UPI0025C45F2B|nr:hypothetical protein [Bifidobacterium sp. UBA744]